MKNRFINFYKKLTDKIIDLLQPHLRAKMRVYEIIISNLKSRIAELEIGLIYPKVTIEVSDENYHNLQIRGILHLPRNKSLAYTQELDKFVASKNNREEIMKYISDNIIRKIAYEYLKGGVEFHNLEYPQLPKEEW